MLTLILAACAVPSGPRIVDSNALRLTVDWSHAPDALQALAMADDYCSRYGRLARFASQRSEFENVYECVPR
jgi:hypothetical protein